MVCGGRWSPHHYHAPLMSDRFASRTTRLRSSAIRDLLKVTEMPDMLSLAGGLPTPDSFPLPDLRREADRLLGAFTKLDLQRSPAAAVAGTPAAVLMSFSSSGSGQMMDPEVQP